MRFLVFLLFSLLTISLFSQDKVPPQLPVVVDAQTVSYDPDRGVIRAKGKVKITYKEIKVFCEEAEVDTNTSIGKLKGGVRIEHKEGIIYGENTVYNFEKKTAEITDFRLSKEPFYAYGESVEKVSEEEYHLNRGYVTTCNLPEPHYRFSAKKILFYPGRKIVAKNVVLKVGKIPVFYIPYYLQPAKDKLPRVSLVPGKDKDMGFYILSAWRYYFNEAFKGRLHLDYYQNKGLGRGITHKYTTDDFGEGILKLYYIDDKDKVSFEGLPTGSDRYKVQFRHTWKISPRLNSILEFHKFSDIDFMKDYFYREYERDSKPLSYLLFNYSLGGGSFSLLTQKRVNRFWSQTEYLPRLRLDIFRAPLANSKFYFESDYSLANLTYKEASPSAEDSDAIRADFYNRLTYQDRIAWLRFTPYVALRETYYSKNIWGEENILRTVFYGGVELSTKLYKQFNSPLNFLGMRAEIVRHIITPLIKYTYIHRPTTSSDLLMDFDSIDKIEGKNKISFSLENRLQARYKEKVWDLLYFSPSVDYLFNQEGRGSHFYELNYDLEFKPFDNFYFEQELKYDLDKSQVKEADSDFVFRTLLSKLSLGHRYVQGESSQITYSFNYKISPRWEFFSYGRYEAKTGEWEEQQYYLRRDLHCWWADIGIDVDRDRALTFWVIFRIKAFPKIGISFQQSYHGPKE